MNGPRSLSTPELTIDLATRSIFRPEGLQTLTSTEARLLGQLLAGEGAAISAEALLVAVWGRSWEGTPEELRPVRTTISRLRQKVERDPRSPRHILTDQGEGYRWATPGVPAPSDAPTRRFTTTPGEPYRDRGYVPNPASEASCLAHLAGSSQPLVLVGPWKVGKTWLGERLLGRCREQGDTTVRLGPRLLDEGTLSSSAALIDYLVTELGDAAGLGIEDTEAVRTGPGTPAQRLKRFMERRVLPSVATRLVFWVDDADRLALRGDHSDFFAMLRGWAEDQRPVWDRLRLVLTTTTDPSRLITRLQSSPFNIGHEIPVRGWPAETVRAWADGEALWSAFGGHPFWSRWALWEAAEGDGDLPSLLARLPQVNGPLGAPLGELRRRLEARTSVAALQAWLRGRGLRSQGSVDAPSPAESMPPDSALLDDTLGLRALPPGVLLLLRRL